MQVLTIFSNRSIHLHTSRSSTHKLCQPPNTDKRAWCSSRDTAYSCHPVTTDVTSKSGPNTAVVSEALQSATYNFPVAPISVLCLPWLAIRDPLATVPPTFRRSWLRPARPLAAVAPRPAL